MLKPFHPRPAIGNDIVDLHVIDSPACQHVGFLERVCTPAELRLVRESASPDHCLAILWASKEAVYKLLVQEGIGCKFIPRDFVTAFEKRTETPPGWEFPVSYRGICCKVVVAVTSKWVHAIATIPAHCVVRWTVREFESSCSSGHKTSDESVAARRLAADLLSGSGHDDVVLAFQGRVPMLMRNGENAGIGISLSHHGAFAAAAIAWISGSSPRPSRPVDRDPSIASASEEMCSTCTA